MVDNQLKVAVFQMTYSDADINKNREKISHYIEQAAIKGANIFVSPELSNVSYNLNLVSTIKYNYSDEVSYYSALAKKHNITLALGLLEQENDLLFNSLIVINEQGIVISKYRKMNLFPLGKESIIFKKGLQPEVLSIGNFIIGLTICYEIRFPELFRMYLEKGCNVIIVSSAFPSPRLEHWKTLLKAHAILNQSYIVASNCSGSSGSLQFVGNSCFIDPWGTEISSLNNLEEGMILENLDINKIEEVRNKIPAAKERLVSYPPIKYGPVK